VVVAIALMDRGASTSPVKATVAALYIGVVAGIQIALGFWPCPHWEVILRRLENARHDQVVLEIW